MDDDFLLARAQQFDQEALGEIYDIYSPKLYAYAYRLLGDVQSSEECVAETYYRFLQSLRGGSGPHTFLKAYLYRIAHNWIIDYYRRKPVADAFLPDRLAEEGPGPEKLASQNMEQEQIRAALLQLTPDQRQVVLLKFYEGWDNDVIAEMLQKPVGSIKSLQHRALGALRRSLRQIEELNYEPTD